MYSLVKLQKKGAENKKKHACTHTHTHTHACTHTLGAPALAIQSLFLSGLFLQWKMKQISVLLFSFTDHRGETLGSTRSSTQYSTFSCGGATADSHLGVSLQLTQKYTTNT